MYSLYIGDKDEDEVLGWLIQNVSELASTTKEEFNYFNTYRGAGDKWVMNTTDVSDVSGQFDEIALIVFALREDAIMAKLRFGGSMS